MKRILLGLASATALAALPAAPASARPPRVQARLTACHPRLDPAARSVSARAAMRAIPRTSQMGVRFDLLRRERGASTYTRVSVPLLGIWNRSHRGVGRYRVEKEVDNLTAPARYRFRVSFRWYDSRGRILKTVQRRTGVCFQPELRPDLRFVRITTAPVPDHPKQTRYVATVKNAGGTPSGPFDLAFSFPGMPVRTKAVPSIGPGEVVAVRFVGPLCTEGATPSFTLDPGNAVQEVDETDDSLTVTCSAIASA